MSRRRTIRRQRQMSRLFRLTLSFTTSAKTAELAGRFKRLHDFDPLDRDTAAMDLVGLRVGRTPIDRIIVHGLPGNDSWVRTLWKREPVTLAMPDPLWPSIADQTVDL